MEHSYKAYKVSSRTRDLVNSALLVSLVFISTRFLNIRLPISINGGLIHLGNTMLFMSAIVFGRRKGAIAGAFGMAIFDVLSGWAAWAPFTFLIRGIMGYIVGSFANAKDREGNSLIWNITGITIAGVLMLIGYYITEVILYGNFISPVTSIPGNVIQLVVGALVGIPASAALKRTRMV